MRNPSRASAVVFDCDSTLSAIEGVDELAAERRAEVAALTAAAMRGEIPLEQVYGRRLELIRPTRSDLDRLAERYVAALVPDAREVVAAIASEGVAVRIMSGGLLPAVLAVADALGVPHDGVAAVPIRFAADGAYAGFDAASPLARSGGKCDVLRAWRAALGAWIVMVGDGATDLDAAGAADLFVAYAGVVDRPEVTSAADVVVRSRSLAPVLPIALGGEPSRSPEHRALFERGLSLLDDRDRLRLSQRKP